MGRLVFGAVLFLVAASSAIAETQEFHSSPVAGPVHVPYPATGGPAGPFQSMMIDMGSGWGFDHHLQEFSAWPDDAQRSFYYNFSDSSGQGHYFTRSSFLKLPSPLPVQYASARACRGTCRIAIPRPVTGVEAFALRGFQFRKRDGDFHIHRIAIRPAVMSGYIDVIYRDNDGEDLFDVDLQFYRIPQNKIWALPLTCRGNAQAPVNASQFSHCVGVPGSQASPFISGFDFQYLNGDHHVWLFNYWFSPENYTNKPRMILQDVHPNDDPYAYTVFYGGLKN